LASSAKPDKRDIINLFASSRRPIPWGGTIMKLHLVCAALGLWLSAHGFAQNSDPKQAVKKPAEARYQFAMDAKPWQQVLQWLSDTSGKPVVHDGARPTGNLTFIGPKNKTYTLAEIVEILNEGLRRDNLRLVHGEKAYALTAANESSLKSYAAPDGKAESIAKLFQEIFAKGPNTKITALSPQEIVVYGVLDVHMAVARGLESLRSPMTTATLPLGSVEAAKAIEILRSLYGSKGPHIVADEERQALLVRGSHEQIAEVKTFLQQFQQPGNMRVIKLDKGSASALAEELQKLMKGMRSNPIEIIQPHLEPPPAKPEPAPKKSGFKKEPLKKEPPRQDEAKLPGNPKAPVRIVAFGNRVMVSADDLEALMLVGDLARLLIGTVPTEFEIIRVHHAKAVDLAKVLNDALIGSTVAPMRIVADPGSNSLLVKAGPLDMHSVRKLLARLDSEDAADAGSAVLRLTSFRLKNAVAGDLVKTLQELYGKDKSFSLAADSRTNSIMVRATSACIDELAATISRLDQD
jgi:type II secretory pathway component GspD/PulD (secretin)